MALARSRSRRRGQTGTSSEASAGEQRQVSLQQASRNRHFLLGERSDATRTLQASGPSDRLTEEMTRLEEQVLTEGLGKLRFLHNIAGLYITHGSGIAVNTL